MLHRRLLCRQLRLLLHPRRHRRHRPCLLEYHQSLSLHQQFLLQHPLYQLRRESLLIFHHFLSHRRRCFSFTLSASVEPSSSPLEGPSVSRSPSVLPAVRPSASVRPSYFPSQLPSGSQSPSAIPSTEPSHSPVYVDTCDDSLIDAFFVDEQRGERGCIWLVKRPDWQLTLCVPGHAAFDICEETCGKSGCTQDLFKHWYEQKVGSKVALFWLAWAWVAERKGDYAFCEQIYKKAISEQAVPLELLKQRQEQFQRRMSRHRLNATRQLQKEEQEENHHRSKGIAQEKCSIRLPVSKKRGRKRGAD